MKRFVLLAFAILYSTPLFGQVNGAVTGVVSDATQAVLPSAAVTLTLIDTGVVSQTLTNEAGVYRFPSVRIGRYSLRIVAPGFKAFVQEPIIVETSQTVRVDASLEIGTTQDSVTVTADAVVLERETSDIATQISNSMVNSLPFQLTNSIRNPFAFVRLTPGAVGTSGAGDGTRIAGSRTYGNEAYIDGVPVSYNPWQNVAGPAAPALETVAEFRVETALAPAEYGRTGGGAVLMATRSGTNQLHGNVFSLFRNNVLDARRYNATTADINRQGEFGGSLGGPVYIPKLYNGRNRTFFFANYTGFRRAGGAQGRSVTVPTERMRNGDFGEGDPIFDPLTASGSAGRQQFPGNIIPRNRMSAIALKFQEIYPLPNAAGVNNNYLNSVGDTLTLNSQFIKIDHSFNDRNRVSGSYRWRGERTDRSNGILPAVSDYVYQGITSHNAVVAVDTILRPNLLNRVQLGYTRFFSPILESGDAGISVPGAFEPGFPGIRFSGQGIAPLGYGNDRSPVNNNGNLLQSIAWTKGTHNFKFGTRVDIVQHNQAVLGFREGQYTFSQFGTSQPQVARTGHSYASFLLGLVNNGTMGYSQPTSDRSRYFAVFAQDDWKITRRLTLNYGYRWEFQTPFTEQHRRLSRMDPTVPNPGADGYPGAMVFAGDGPGRSGVSNFLLTYYGAHAPRLGLAYQLTKSTVVRAGAGLFYSPLAGLDNSKQGFNASINVSSLDGGLTPAFQLDSGWPAGLVTYPPFIDPTLANGQAASTTEFRPGGSGRLPRTSQWQFSVQQLVKEILFEASYVGTVAHGVTNSALVAINQINPSYLSLGPLLTRNITDPAVVAAGYRPPYPSFRGTLAQSLRAFPQYQDIRTMDSPSGNSSYHALFLKAEKRYSHGLHFLVSYAFSKTLTDVTFTNTDLAGPQDQFNRRAEKSIADVDVPQRLTVSFSYELPFGPGKSLLRQRGIAGHIVGGWSVAGILSYDGGSPLRISIPNNLPIFNGHLRPMRVAGLPIRQGPGHGGFEPLNGLTGQRGDLFLNRDAFAVPAPFTLGNLGLYLPDVRAFGSRTEDLSVVKRIVFAEQRRVELRGDFFNAFNRRNYNSPVTDLTNANFGRITGQRPARIAQLGLRVDF